MLYCPDRIASKVEAWLPFAMESSLAFLRVRLGLFCLFVLASEPGFFSRLGAQGLPGQDGIRTPLPNQVLELDGTNSFLELPKQIFEGLPAATIVGWVWIEQLAPSHLFEFGGGSHSMWLGTVDFNPDLHFEIGEKDRNKHSVAVAGVLAARRWFHVAASSGPGGMRLYFNGQPVGRDAYDGSFSKMGTLEWSWLGRDSNHDEDVLEHPDMAGRWDDVSVWDRQLTDGEIQKLMQFPAGGTEPGLVGLWTFDDGKAMDHSIGGHPGKMRGQAHTVPLQHPLPKDAAPLTRLEGRVSNATRQPTEGAIVQLLQRQRVLRETTTDSSGYFQLYLQPSQGAADLLAEDGNEAAWVLGIQAAEGETVKVGMSLAGINTIEGRVTALDDAPLSGVVVQAVHWYPETGPEHADRPFQVEKTALTDSSGSYRLPLLRPGSYQVRIQSPGRNPIATTTEPFVLAAGGGTNIHNFNVPPLKKGIWESYNSDDAVYSRSVRSLFQDRSGYLWIGTRNGLFRFDGAVMTRFTMDNGEAGDDIASISEDLDGVLWVVAENSGLSRREGDRFVRVHLSDESADRSVQGVHADSQGRVWVGGAGLFCVTRTNLLRYSVTNGLPANYVYKITSGPGKTLWLATDEGLVSRINERFVNVTRQEGEPPFIVDGPRVDRRGKVWFGSWDRGLWCYDPSVQRGAALRHWSTLEGLPSDRVWSVEVDSDDSVWVATANGISHFDGSTFVNYNREDGLPDLNVSSICRSSDGALWIGTQGALSRFEPNGNLTLTTADGLPSNQVIGVAPGNDHRVWVATAAGLATWDGQQVRDARLNRASMNGSIRAIANYPDGRVCVATTTGVGLYGTNGFSALSAKARWEGRVTCLSVSPDGAIAAGSTSGYLLRWQHPQVDADISDESPLSHEAILSVICVSKDHVWVGMDAGAGVKEIQVAPDGRLLRHIFKATNGLVDDRGLALALGRANTLWIGGERWLTRYQDNIFRPLNDQRLGVGERVNTLAVDTDGILWMGGGSGVRFHDGRSWSRLDQGDGLPANTVSRIVADPDGGVWFATGKGVMQYHRRRVMAPAPRVSLENSEQRGSPSGSAAIRKGEQVTFQWQVTEFRTPRTRRLFRWGFVPGNPAPEWTPSEEFWNESQGVGGLTWSTNRVGNYTLLVQYVDRDLNYSVPTRFPLVIRTPWFEDPVVVVPFVILNGALLGWGIWIRILYVRKQREAERLREQLLEEERQARLDAERAGQQIARQNLELEEARNGAESANRAKSRFLANMSHELRTPLNAIKGYAELVQEELSERGEVSLVQDLDRICKAANIQLALVNDILDLSKIEAGKMLLHVEPFEMTSVIREVESVVRPLIAQKGNHLAIEGLPESCPMQSDQTRLKQVLINLLSNAAKFTEKGRVVLTIELTNHREQSAVSIRVADSGIGMTEEQMSRLFQAFSQADTMIVKRYGGTGLGLAIARQLAQLLGGELTVKSRLGEGSTFCLIIPRQIEIQ